MNEIRLNQAGPNVRLFGQVTAPLSALDGTSSPDYTLFSPAQSLAQKMRRLAAKADVSNAIINTPLSPTPAWAAGTYVQGQIVNSGTNDYICVVGGTSATAPSGTSQVLVADGSVRWQYYGLTNPVAASMYAPAVSFSSSAASGLTLSWNALAQPQNFVVRGGNIVQNGTKPLQLNVVCKTLITGALYGDYYSVSFEVDDIKFDIVTANYGKVARILVDGAYLSASGIIANVTNPTYTHLDFTNAGGRKKRLVTVELNETNTAFQGVQTSPTGRVNAPSTSDDLRVYFFGCSIEQGNSSYWPTDPARSWVIRASKRLGWNDPWNGAFSGTGYLQPNTGGNYPNYLNHVQDAINAKPQIIVFGGPVNDSTYGWTSAQITAQALLMYQTLRAALPDTLMIVTGCFSEATGPSATVIAGERAVAAAVAQFNDPLTYFIPTATDPQGPWISGTGNITAQTGTGNADNYIGSDGTHPDQAGGDYWGDMFVTAVKNLILNSGNPDSVYL